MACLRITTDRVTSCLRRDISLSIYRLDIIGLLMNWLRAVFVIREEQSMLLGKLFIVTAVEGAFI